MLSNARISLFLLLCGSSSSLYSALPELSSIDPIEFDEGAQRLVARGDARLDFDNTRVRADRITYYQKFNLADALGNVEVGREGYRLIADRLNYDAEENLFAVDVLRTGRWPFYLSGVTAGGSPDDATVEGGTIYYGDPGPWTLSVASETVRYVHGDEAEYVEMEAATFRIGDIPVFYLPGYRHYVTEAPFLVDVSGGADSELGGYLQTTTLFPVTPWLRMGANLDIYTKRGALAGPAAQYVYHSDTQTIRGALSTGYIKDQGDPEEDIFDDPINEDRGFAEWRHRHRIGERFSLTAQGTYWSDSEATRDFRDDYFDANRQPDSFAEAVYAGDNYLISAFGRFRPNDFQLIQERLPEVRFDLLPVPVFQTGAYHRASASYARLRENYGRVVPAFGDHEYDRFDLNYRLQRPLLLQDWLTLTPVAGARVSHYANQESAFAPPPLPDDEFTQEIYEFGFDLVGRFHASYPTVNRTWDINGLRHVLRPVLRYRYYSDPDSEGEIAPIEREAFDLARPLLDLSDIRAIDGRTERHLARLGVENLFQTRAEGYGSRTLAALNFYQDILFEKNTRFDGGEEDRFNATWVELILDPAPWLKFDLAARFKTESLTLEELRTRTRLVSGEIWEIGLSTDLLNKRVDQYRLDFVYRVNERYAVLADLRLDADKGELTEFGLGLRTRLGSTWELIYALTFREDARRESDVEFSVRLNLADYE
ncbi:MAG: LPS assembly protein LptD [Opitutales bacterium]